MLPAEENPAGRAFSLQFLGLATDKGRYVPAKDVATSSSRGNDSESIMAEPGRIK